jgi:diaminopimelate epimerase
MKFTKVHSLGNDFLIIDLPKKERLSSINDLAKNLCDRHTGVGADGVLLISVQNRTKGTVNFRIFNADGTEAEVSGNGLRCAAASLHYDKKIESPSILFFTTA